MKKNPLGRGLGALLEDNASSNPEIISLRISQISPNRGQPRKDFDAASMNELAESIKLHGVIQPILVCESATGYMIVAGERRWRAARMVGLEEIPAIICEYDEQTASEVALIENLQREGLNPVEEAAGYKKLMESYGFTQEQTAERVGKPRSTIANSLRILSLPQTALELLRSGKLSGGHAKVLVGLEAEEAEELAVFAAEHNLSVRELEKLVKERRQAPVKKTAKPLRDSFYDEAERSIKALIGRRVKVIGEPKGKKPGRLEIEFFSREDLTELAKMLADAAEK